MTIQRPHCMKAFRQGFVRISLSPAARSCAGPSPAIGVTAMPGSVFVPAAATGLPRDSVLRQRDPAKLADLAPAAG